MKQPIIASTFLYMKPHLVRTQSVAVADRWIYSAPTGYNLMLLCPVAQQGLTWVEVAYVAKDEFDSSLKIVGALSGHQLPVGFNEQTMSEWRLVDDSPLDPYADYNRAMSIL